MRMFRPALKLARIAKIVNVCYPHFTLSYAQVDHRWPTHGVLKMPRGIALDVKNKNMLVSDKRLNAVLTFHFPEVF